MNFLMKSLKWVTIIFVGIPVIFLILHFFFQRSLFLFYVNSFWNFFVLYLLAFYIYICGGILTLHYLSRKQDLLKLFPLFFLVLVCLGEWISMKILTADGDYGHPFGIWFLFIPLVLGHLLAIFLMAAIEAISFKIKNKNLNKK